MYEIKELVKHLHVRPEDFIEGDLIHRIERFQTYVLKRLPTSSLNSYEWEFNDALANEYANMDTEIPPIVYDPLARPIIDGTHRVRASEIRGDKTILAYVGENPDPNWNDNDEIEYE